MPEAGPLAYLADLLAEVGEAQSTGDGLIATSWHEFRSWAYVMGLRLSPFEFGALRRLSGAYVDQYYKATDKSCVSPCFESDRDAVEDKARSLFALMRSPSDD